MCIWVTVILLVVILIKLFLEAENVKYVLSYETTLFWPDYKAPFYRYISDPDSNPVSDPDSNPDPKRLFRFRIGSGQKIRILPDPDPQHCIRGPYWSAKIDHISLGPSAVVARKKASPSAFPSSKLHIRIFGKTKITPPPQKKLIKLLSAVSSRLWAGGFCFSTEFFFVFNFKILGLDTHPDSAKSQDQD